MNTEENKNIDAETELMKELGCQMNMAKENKNIDAEAELMKELGRQMGMTKEEKYKEIKDILNIESFMVATDGNLNMLFKYMFSATKGIRLSNIQVGEFIKDEYGDDFFLRRELLKMEEAQRKDY